MKPTKTICKATRGNTSDEEPGHRVQGYWTPRHSLLVTRLGATEQLGLTV
jgi:hypothetical protein